MATISIRIDDDTKSKLDSFARGVGANTSTILKMFATKVAREQRIPFEVEMDPFYSANNQKHLARSIADAKAGKLTVHELIED